MTQTLARATTAVPTPRPPAAAPRRPVRPDRVHQHGTTCWWDWTVCRWRCL